MRTICEEKAAWRWMHCERFGFPVRNQTASDPGKTWVAFTTGGVAYGSTAADAVDAAIRGRRTPCTADEAGAVKP